MVFYGISEILLGLSSGAVLGLVWGDAEDVSDLLHPLFPGLAGALLESSRDEFPLLVLDGLHLLLDAVLVDELDNLTIPQLE